jgi:hypothetical protein
MPSSMTHNLGGDAPLPDWENIGNPAGRGWTERRLSQFGVTYKSAADKVAFINLIPYRSDEGAKDMRMVERLASSRCVRRWAHDTLFREARDGKRIVVCLRSARVWGLQPDTEQGLLFTPQFNRASFMLHGAMREKIGLDVRRAVLN